MKWISVKDKLPESPAWVLVYSDGAMNCMWYYRGKWSDPTGAQGHNIVMADISHWMPLPDRPIEEATQKLSPDDSYTYETVQDGYVIFGPNGRKMPGWDVVNLLNQYLESRK